MFTFKKHVLLFDVDCGRSEAAEGDAGLGGGVEHLRRSLSGGDSLKKCVSVVLVTSSH